MKLRLKNNNIDGLQKEANKILASDMWFDSVDQLQKWYTKINKLVDRQKYIDLNKFSEDYKFKIIDIAQDPLELEFVVPMKWVLLPNNNEIVSEITLK